ncbi:MAG: hypothetical protein M1530_03725, partial [Candidatus Marsarchaeota archaeon]|nr:hypothetical protein [Candidatus Marsarchaeota archaeon]
MDAFEAAFEETTRILLGRGLSGFYALERWLSRHVPMPYPAKSMKSGREVWMPPPQDFLGRRFSTSNVVSMSEGELNAPSPFKPGDLEGADVEKIRRSLIQPIATYWGDFRYKTHENVQKSSGCGDCLNLYMCEDVYHGAKNVAFCKSVLYSQNMFGCSMTTHSSYCVHTHNSVRLTRCFEMDACTDCSDCYFCHNAENCTECMFCFNVKAKRYAIGNVEYPKEQYLQVKKMVLAEISAKLEKAKKLDLDIYNIG